MAKLFLVEGQIQNYAWGGTQYIPNLLDVKTNGEQCAEYWLGAHSKAPSTIKTTEGDKTLDTYISNNLNSVLGDNIASAFGRLPFLFKVLDVRDMLSIQVHPTKVEAEKGFKKENEAGIPLTAKHRNYKDDNHKPEIMVALSEFWLLHGFLTEAKLKAVLESVPEFKHLISVFEAEGYFGLYKTVMEEPQEETNKVLQPLVDRILPLYKAGKLEKQSPDYWAAKAVDSADDASVLDKGIYSIYFFNIVKANKGEAVFQDAGIPHAYLEGQNMELMANSDNVLRGGLTPKHVDVPELLKHVAFNETVPNVMQGDLQADGIERIYKSPAPDFQLSLISLEASKTYKSTSKTAEIIIVIEGEAEVNEGETTVGLAKGQAAFLAATSQYTIQTKSNAIIYKATAPQS
ncbi:mannose-6-phosphate isomerase, class I [Neotamlana laminarinivorans]|uniref:mannose-6-phosphate isomerase n=1 Tax=Neotamlana laminarinivorans TaxID=2883124 RepID=A0A9X1L1V1_9FLAO|nr:mannose-6-phosphate isomerase, class I [Tamlana laminarinivorans]MCB4799110.1 mannose-6-phosphate isomerase, class I [Tamlana laminarinivorans]